MGLKNFLVRIGMGLGKIRLVMLRVLIENRVFVYDDGFTLLLSDKYDMRRLF